MSHDDAGHRGDHVPGGDLRLEWIFFAVSRTAAGRSTVPIFMVKFVTSEGLFRAKLFASATMAVLPIVLIGWIAQRQLVRGLSLGAVK
ncbi:MAG TPA: hypothetical protein VGR16_03370 [Thermomicrobiales bacterium]|nr:hypothetical protein [Thermomicrobiales bacterium]